MLSQFQIDELKRKGLTDEQIRKYSSGQSSQPKSAGDFLFNQAPTSLGQFVSDTVKGVVNIANPNPEQNTLANLTRFGVGAVTKAIPGNQGKSEDMFNQVVSYYKDRYKDNLSDTLYSDPFGAASDFAMFLSGGGAALKTASIGGRINTLAKAGEKLSKAGLALDPTTPIIKGTGALLEKATDGRNISLPGAKGNTDTAAIAAAERAGIDTTQLPASAVNKSRVLTAIEAYNAKGLFSDKAKDMFVSGMAQLNSFADNFVRSLGVGDSLSDVGDAITNGVAKYKDKWIKEKNALYAEATEFIDAQKATVPMTQTVQVLSKLIDEKKLAAGVTPIGKEALAVLEEMQKRIGDTQPSLRAVRAALKEINTKAKPGAGDPVVVADQAAFRALAQAMSNDIDIALQALLVDDAGRKILSKLDAANKLYQEGLEKMNSALGKKIQRNAKTPDKIVDLFLMPSTSVNDMIRMIEAMGPEAVQPLQRAVIEKIFSRSRNAEGNFRPEGLNRELSRLGEEKLSVLFDENQIGALKDIDTLAQSMGRVSKVLTGSQTAFLGRISALIGAFGFLSPVTALKLIAGDFMFNKFIESNAGQKFLRGDLKLDGAVGRKIKESAEGVTEFVQPLREIEQATDDTEVSSNN